MQKLLHLTGREKSHHRAGQYSPVEIENVLMQAARIMRPLRGVRIALWREVVAMCRGRRVRRSGRDAALTCASKLPTSRPKASSEQGSAPQRTRKLDARPGERWKLQSKAAGR